MRSILFTLFLFTLLPHLSAQIVYVCRLDPMAGSTSAAFAFEETVSFELDYDATNLQVQIIITPLSGGQPTPNVSLLDAPGILSGEGTVSRSFSISGPDIQIVDELMVQVQSEDGSENYLTFAIPLRYYFSPAGVSNFQLSAAREFSSMLLGESVDLSFNYNISDGDIIQVLARPTYQGEFLSNTSTVNEVMLSGTGSHSQSFSVDAGVNQKADAIRVQLISMTEGELAGFSLPVNYVWSSVKISNPSAPTLDLYANGEDLDFLFDYSGEDGNGEVLFSATPYSFGSPTPAVETSDDLTLAATTNTVNRSSSFSVDSTNQRVDALLLELRRNGDNTLLLSMDYPLDLYFGDFLVSDIQFCPPSPARLLPGQIARGFLDYTNNTADSVRMFVRALVSGSGIGFSGHSLQEPGNNTVFFFTRVNGTATSFGHRVFPTPPDVPALADFRYNSSFYWGDPLVSSTYSPLAPQSIDWEIGPNPMQEQSLFQLEALIEQELEVELYDALGRSIHRWPGQQLLAGQAFSIVIDRQALGLQSGSYFLLVQAAGYHLVEKISVQ